MEKFENMENTRRFGENRELDSRDSRDSYSRDSRGSGDSRDSRGGGYSRDGGYNRDSRGGGYGGDSRGGGYSRDSRGGGDSRDNRGGGFSRDSRGSGDGRSYERRAAVHPSDAKYQKREKADYADNIDNKDIEGGVQEPKLNYIFGMHPVIEAVKTGKNIEKIMLKQGLEGELFRDLMEIVHEKKINVQYVPMERLNWVTRGTHQGVIAFMSKIDFVTMEDMMEAAFLKSKTPIFIMLDGVSDVRNFGAIARTAECAGVAGIILPAKGGAAINADAIKTSAGALLRLNTHRAQNLRIPINTLKEAGFQIIGASEKAEGDITNIDFKKPTVIIMGSEGKGISKSVLDLCDTAAKIPMVGEIGSLNVSIATAICLYEATRQRME